MRIKRVVDSTLPSLDPFAADIVQHYKCWMKYATDPLHQPYVSRHSENDIFLKSNFFPSVTGSVLTPTPCLQLALNGARMPANQRWFLFDVDFPFSFQGVYHPQHSYTRHIVDTSVEECSRFEDASFV